MNEPRLSMMRPATLTGIAASASSSLVLSAYFFCRTSQYASRIKDLRTNIERSDCDKVLDGDIDEYLEASLKSGL